MIHASLPHLLCDVAFPSAVPTFDVGLTSTRAGQQMLTTKPGAWEPGAGPGPKDPTAQGERQVGGARIVSPREKAAGQVAACAALR